MRKNKINLCIALLMILISISFVFQMNVLAAQGNIYISLSKQTMDVGDTVDITVGAVDSGNNSITATMKVNFDMELFSFVSCSESSYEGGEGGTVTVVGSTVVVTVKVKKTGTGGISVVGSNGSTEAGDAIEEITGASIPVSIGGEATGDSSTAESGNPSLTDGQTGKSDNMEGKSSDNSLSSLKISPGTLSPEFAYNITKYTANVSEDVNEISVDAKTSNPSAKIESIEGNTSLKAGENTIIINVKAENGVAATYTIVVTKGGSEGSTQDKNKENSETKEENKVDNENKNPNEILINGITYHVESEFSSEEIPNDFEETVTNYAGKEVKSARFNNGHIILLYLKSEEENAKNGFYVYNEVQDVFQPFIKISFGEKYAIVLYPSLNAEIPEGFSKAQLKVLDHEGVIGYQYSENELDSEQEETSDVSLNNSFQVFGLKPLIVHASEVEGETNQETDEELSTYGEAQVADVSDFYLLYAMNNDGVEGWYRYDNKEGTIQRYVETAVQLEGSSEEVKKLQKAMNKMIEDYKEEKASLKKWNIILIAIIAILIFVIITIFIFRRSAKEELEEDSIFEMSTMVREKRRPEKRPEKREKDQNKEKIQAIKKRPPIEQVTKKRASLEQPTKNPTKDKWVDDYDVDVPKITKGDDFEVMDLNDL